jgi:pilus assembly protein CpaB
VNKRFLAVLAFALVVSLIASTIVYQLIVGRVTSQAKQAGTQIVVAARDLPVGTMLKPEDLKPVDWTGTIQPQWVTKVDDAVGRGVIANLYLGEPIVATRLAMRGAGAGMAETIPSGMRAVAVRVNEVIGLAGFILPGMRVDLIGSGSAPNDTRQLGTLTRTLLQNIEVLSAGQSIQKDTDGKPVTVQVVNLLVTPEQAEIVSLASKETQIQLVLRNPLDTEESKPPGTATALLFKEKPAGLAGLQAALPRPWRPAPKPVVTEKVTTMVAVPINMEVINGSKKENTKVGQKMEEHVKEVVK